MEIRNGSGRNSMYNYKRAIIVDMLRVNDPTRPSHSDHKCTTKKTDFCKFVRIFAISEVVVFLFLFPAYQWTFTDLYLPFLLMDIPQF